MIIEILKKLSSTHISAWQVFLGIFLFIVGIGLLYLIYCKCTNFLASKNKKGHLLVKSLLIALSPFLVSVFTISGANIPNYIFDILMVICTGIVLIWNISSMGIFHGFLYTVLNFALGNAASFGFLIVVIIVVLALIFGRDGSSEISTASPIENRMKEQEKTDKVDWGTTWNWGNDGIYSNGKRIQNVEGNYFIDSDGNYLTLTSDGKYYIDSDGNYHRVFHDDYD